ncbi:MAG: hypothetical protein RLZZ200_1788 [Pseudomonadota bacterium]|jgi:aminoglycoside/choline kinase family phosphotransferase
MPFDTRLQMIRDWLASDLSLGPCEVVPASEDASFRRYFRVTRAAGPSFVVMDAPPDKEDVSPFLRITALLEQCGVHVPHVHESDVRRGLLLMEDLGSTHLLTRLGQGADPELLYRDALDALVRIQVRGLDASRQLDPYDAVVLRREMRLMPEWFCGRHLGLVLTDEDRALIEAAEEFLIDEALAQPGVFVHRDYHSRNLMVLPERSPGVIDYQDALRGPAAYDAVSILKDCYVGWPRARVEAWLQVFRDRLVAQGGAPLAGSSLSEYLRWFDLIGLQRHIKVLGIFARLNWRDGKPAYLDDLPLVLGYVRETVARFPELAAYSRFVETRLLPGLPAANARARAGH